LPIEILRFAQDDEMGIPLNLEPLDLAIVPKLTAAPC